jgi:uncharacterized phage protein (TIGR02218 family)
MTFNVIENSNDDGRPIYLYAFTAGAATWRYTSSDADVTIDGYRWTAVPISDDGAKITGDANTDTLTITAPSTIAPAQLFIGTPPATVVMVHIRYYHEGDNESILGYVGEVQQVNQPTPGTAKISCDTISASMKRDGLRLTWQRNCPYMLYDQTTCRADKTQHKLDLVVFDIVGVDVQFSGMDDVDDGVFDGGYIEWDHPARGTEYRTIERQIGTVCSMFGLADGLYYGLAVRAYPGCRRNVEDCTNKFNNLDNYGGSPDLPGKSPFDGDPVY